MNADNPYAAPEAELIPTWTEPREELAARSARFAASLVDGIIGLLYGIPIIYGLGIWTYMSAGQAPPIGLTVAAGVLGFLVFMLVHGYFLKASGQTLGKKLAGIRIADLDGRLPDFGKVVLLRYLPISVVSQVPVVGTFLPMVDVLFIFRGDRRCVHDLLAGTKVVVTGVPR